jgi:hypothetical protein
MFLDSDKGFISYQDITVRRFAQISLKKRCKNDIFSETILKYDR